MSSSYRKKPLAQLEFGTRIHAPSGSESRYRVVCNDPTSGERIFLKCRTEEVARAKARELEQFVAQSTPIRDRRDRIATKVAAGGCSTSASTPP